MTTEEKKKAILDECNKYEDCDDCPHQGGYCDKYNSGDASPEIIDKWYAEFFECDEPHIKDSGERREFTTGAVRDIQEGKGRCDLMPLDVVGEMFNKWFDDTCGEVFFAIANFQCNGCYEHLRRALDVFMSLENHAFDTLSEMFLEVAKHFEEGAKKYGEHNWQKGIPVHCYIDSAIRHYLKWLRGDNDEPHDRAFVWNIICCIWTCQHKPELNEYRKGGDE